MILKLIALVLLAELSSAQVPVAQVFWNGQNWAHQCDFYENDMGSALVPPEQCGPTCERTHGCTHFTWTTYNGGTCWMKSGTVSKDDAFLTEDSSMVCGLLNDEVFPEPVKGKLVWSSEFNSVADFEQDWKQETGGHGWGNNELQYYTDSRHNVNVTDGELTIEARRENKMNMGYTSARLMSKRTFRYGFYEMRGKLPLGRGVWPAFWLLAANRPLQWPRDGEIDVMEYVGYDPNIVHGTIHCEAYNHLYNTQKGKYTSFDDKVYNLFQMDWKKDSITIYINGKQYFHFRKESNDYNVWPFDNEFNMILNTAVGGNWGGLAGIDNGIFPARYTIDYVRIYDNGEHIQIV